MLYSSNTLTTRFLDRSEWLEDLSLTRPIEYDEGFPYYVKEGDTLFSIANKYYDNPKLWYVIAEHNLLEEIFILEIGQEIIIPNIDG